MKQEVSFFEYVANKCPNDTAVKDHYNDNDMIEMYPELYAAYIAGYDGCEAHLLSGLKNVDDIHEYLCNVIDNDHDVKSIKYSIGLLAVRLGELND